MTGSRASRLIDMKAGGYVVTILTAGRAAGAGRVAAAIASCGRGYSFIIVGRHPTLVCGAASRGPPWSPVPVVVVPADVGSGSARLSRVT